MRDLKEGMLTLVSARIVDVRPIGWGMGGGVHELTVVGHYASLVVGTQKPAESAADQLAKYAQFRA